MNDIEMRRSILQYAYDHRHDHKLQLVGTEEISALKEQNNDRIIHNIRFLKDSNLIRTHDDSWTTISITTQGVILTENGPELDRRFPVRFDFPEQTKKLIDTVEELLILDYPAVLNQFTKAKVFLYLSQPPDYLNCVKEAVGAVEGLAKVVCNRPKGTLSDLLPELKRRHLSHPAMAKIIEAIYAVRSDEPGIGHGAYSASNFEYVDAEFFLNISACLIIYLTRKATDI